MDWEKKRIAGTNVIHFKVMDELKSLQIDLRKNMEIHRILYKGREVDYRRDEGTVWVIFPEYLPVGTVDEFSVVFYGTPQEAKRPPWDGGWVWEKDGNKQPWIATACEGEGASLWFPCKDLLADEPDSMNVSIIIPNSELMAVSNGDLRGIEVLPGSFKKYNWHISYPINLYNVTVNIGNYTYFTDKYKSKIAGEQVLEYYVLADNEEKARKHFQQVKTMLEVYEKYFDVYPFWRDSYALVETPFWGMEHQTAIAYGNEYKNNEFGFDFIIIHETAHEWFGNSISMEDKADMWIHEAFATYAEAVFVEETQGYKQAVDYLETQKKRIENKSVILAPRGVAYDDWQDADMYMKGTWMLHSLRTAVADDKLWFATVRKFCQTFRLKTVNTEQAIAFFNQELGKDYTYLFNEYLKSTETPTLEYKILKTKKGWELYYRWVAKEKGFLMPVPIETSWGKELLMPNAEWQMKSYPFERGVKEFQVTDWGTGKALFQLRKI